MVPYIHSGEAISKMLAGTTPNAPSFLSVRPFTASWIFSLANTEIADPSTMPSTQYPKICRNCRSK